MAALTGSERGLPVGSFLNDTVEAGPDVPQVSVVWQPYDDKVRFFVVVSLSLRINCNTKKERECHM